ncbi:MAG: Holliday junction resolvase RuvX [Firmicutes bacterium]|nr:Holliday junction resolvase RuvX [Bacillota bacterium]
MTGSLLALDLGEKRIGVAVCDPEGLVAVPLGTLTREPLKATLCRIGELVREKEAAAVVIGLPRRTDGSEGPEAVAARDFARMLASHLSIPILFQDERFTTAQAERSLRMAELTGPERRRRVDAVAATLILQGYLDRRRQVQRREQGF